MRNLGEGEAYFVVTRSCWCGDIGDVQHLNPVLIRVARVADVALAGRQGDTVAGSSTVQESEVSGGFGLGNVEVVLGGKGGRFKHHGAAGGPVSDQHFLGATHELAVDGLVSHVEADRLKTAGIAEELEGGGVALLEDQRAGLLAVGGGGQCCVGRCVVDTGHREVDRGDLPHFGIQGEGAAAAGQDVADTVVVEIDRGA